MCWFFDKKKKEEKEQLKQEIQALRLQLELLRADFDNLQLELAQKMQVYQEHIENDKDMEQGNDEVTWSGY
jgi:prefoldin subunit 5